MTSAPPPGDRPKMSEPSVSSRRPVITVFGSSSVGPGDPVYEAAGRLGEAIARAGWVLCNGGYGGTMEAAAAAARRAGGYVVGVTCRVFNSRPNPYLNEEVCAATLAERIDLLIQRADGFVALPGGTGTLAELGLACELVSKRFGRPRPIVLLGDYWMPLIEIADREKGRLRALVCVAATPEQAVERLRERLAC